MAKTATIPNKMQLPDSIGRMNARPLDGDSFFTSLAAARTYAATGATAYIGQVLTVVENGVVTLYKVADASGTLKAVLDEDSPLPSGGGKGVGSRVNLTGQQVNDLIGGTGYTFNAEGTVTVLALYVNGLMQDSTLYAMNGNKLTVSLTAGDPEILEGDTVSILYSVSE